MATYQEERLAEIADAIREKEKSSEPIVATQFAERIAALETGGTAGVRSFNGRTGAVDPAYNDYTPEMVGALSEDGGTLYGDLRIKPSGTYGGKLNFGDGDFVQISEPEEDCLEIKAKRVNFVTSDVTDQKFTLNGEPIGQVDKSKMVTAFNGRSGDVYPEAADYSPELIGAVPVSRRINGQPLTQDIMIETGGVQMAEVQNLINRTDSVTAANTSYGTVMARGIYAGTADMTPGSTNLTSGVIYLQYE